jgi:iron complex transport system substrate-binding protein
VPPTGPSFSRSLLPALLLGWVAAAASAEPLPRVASINLCADQLVLTIAAPEQILTVSWLAADPEESLLAAQAARYPTNYGSAEELLRFDPDVVIAGSYTNAFTRTLLGRLGYTVVELDPETTIAEIETNVRRVAEAVGRTERGEELVREMRSRAKRFAAERPSTAIRGVVIEPGGFTVGEHWLANELLTLAGVRNVAAEQDSIAGAACRWRRCSGARRSSWCSAATAARNRRSPTRCSTIPRSSGCARRSAPRSCRGRIGRAACRKASTP